MTSQVLPPPSTNHTGKLLDEIDDAVLEVNQLKGAAAKENTDGNWQSNSQFDEGKDKTQFRQYEDACERVKSFYKEQHIKQTVAYNLQARVQFKTQKRDTMTIWEALERLNTLIDESDPDTDLSQIEHALQTAEAIRRDGKPRWMQLTGLIHDLGKLLYFYGARGQWDVVGDTFAVGCKFSDKNIYPDTFKENPDYNHPVYSTELGIYSEGCGLENIMISWGHDEYLYHVVKDQSTLPAEALAMIRYHSFYPWHREGAYRQFMNAEDHEMLEAVKAFNPYDLYSKSDDQASAEELKPYYIDLINEFFPNPQVKF